MLREWVVDGYVIRFFVNIIACGIFVVFRGMIGMFIVKVEDVGIIFG